MVAATVLATAIISLYVISIDAYITSLYVISSTSPGQQCPPRYIQVNQDLNQGSGGNFIYLCYSTDPSCGEPVTDILVKSSILPPIFLAASGYSPYSLIDEDLNKGAGGQYIYLLYSKSGTSPLVAISVIAGDSADISAPPGFTKYPQDLNAGAGGKFIYFVYKY